MRGAIAVQVIAALAAAAPTACFSDRGLALEIDVGATAATSVELFLGKAGCNADTNPAGIDCKTITPPGIRDALDGNVWFRDDAARYTAAVAGHIATFRLAAEAVTELPIVIAVGSASDATGPRVAGVATLYDLAIPTASARIVAATLVAAQPVAATPPGPSDAKTLTEERVAAWVEPTSQASACVAVEHWTAGVVTRDFVVPAGDPDCDDVVHECNPSAYLGAEPPGAEPVASCFADTATNACLLGSHGCTDQQGTLAGTCGATRARICLPPQLCACEASGAYPHTECVQNALVPLSPVPHIECTVSAQHEPGRLDLCPGKASVELQFGAHYPGSKCKQPQLGSLALTELDTKLSLHGATWELSSPSDPCTVELSWKDGTRTAPAGDDYGVIALPGERGGMSLVPFVLHFLPNNCATVIGCQVMDSDNSDPQWSCLR
jgi:hypothetical protein